jgi:hypothetical protein
MLIFLTKSHSYVIFLCVKCSLQNNLATAQQTLLGSLYHFIMSLLIFGFNKMDGIQSNRCRNYFIFRRGQQS